MTEAQRNRVWGKISNRLAVSDAAISTETWRASFILWNEIEEHRN